MGWVQAGIHSAPALPELLVTTDLYQDAKIARQKNIPLLIMFSQDDCVYCKIVMEQFLKPMLKSGDYDNKVLMRVVKVDSFDDIRGFDGKLIMADQLGTYYRAYVTPTIVLVDPNGEELTPRLMGISNEHFYGGELDDAINVSFSKMNQLAAN